MSKIKLLIHEVFRQGEVDTGKNTKNGIALFLSVYLKETLQLSIDEKTLVRYYDAFIAGTKKEISIEPYKLDILSKYVGYADFADFSRTFVKKDETANKTTVKINVDEDEESITEKFSKLIINITNEQHFKMPEFVKQNGMGIVGIILIAGVFFANRTQDDKKQKPLIPAFGQLLGAEPEPLKEKNCMYWDKSEYRLADCEDKNPRHDLKPLDSVLLKHFKRINRKDTLNINNALGVTWYSKFYGNVEFFTMDGEDPENGRELRASTAYIIQKYAGK
ncbi:hypothetical protein [Chryseobacterium oranimense]|uniref:hypothetical protein n=1 Tax=Chryseobacterium oranimense TaxID=421058 RepID=UPI002236B503|nr:hypothetical protein [Chryseobacterium oranimense]